MRTIRIFHGYVFDIIEPAEQKNLHPFYLQLWNYDADPDQFARDLQQAKSKQHGVEAINAYVDRVENAIINGGRGYYAVKVHKGKTERSLEISLPCTAGREPGAKRITSSFLVPASIVQRASSDSAHSSCGYVWAFRVKEELKNLSERSLYARQKYERVPIDQPCWPSHLKQQFKDLLLAQLPNVEQIEAADQIATMAAKTAAAARQEQQAQANRAQVTRIAETQRQVTEKSIAERAKRQAKMEHQHNVNVEWFTWATKNGKSVKVHGHAENVSVRISGAASYVLLSGGREIRVATKNLTYL
jgi:hypothetical protein